MRKILLIARREYAETVRTKTFIIGMLMTPLLIGVIMFISIKTSNPATVSMPARVVVITDLTGALSEEITASFDSYNKSAPKRQIILLQVPADRKNLDEIIDREKQKLQQGHQNLYVVIEADVADGGKIRFFSRAKKTPDFDLVPMVRNMLHEVVVQRRCELRNVSPELLADLRRWAPIEHTEVGSSGAVQRARTGADMAFGMMLPFFFMFMMFMGIFGMGQQMVSSVIEEKNSRVIEVLVSAVSPFELMAGKIVGLAGTGLTVMTIWSIAAYGAARWRGLNIDVPPALLGYFVLYYVLGFMLFSSIQAGIGSVCNTIKEAQSLMMPLSFIMIIPMISWMHLVRNPEGVPAQVLSFVPLLTPMIMILRISTSDNLSAFQIIAPTVVLIAAVPGVIWIAAKIFRTGILMYGKRPGLKEVIRWVRQR